jgi:hypothetical protein
MRWGNLLLSYIKIICERHLTIYSNQLREKHYAPSFGISGIISILIPLPVRLEVTVDKSLCVIRESSFTSWE